MLRACFFFLILCLSMQIASGQGSPALDKKNGFRDVKLGAPLTSLKNLTKVGVNPAGYPEYKRTTDVLKLEEVPLKGITYTFYNNKLLSILLELEEENFEAAMKKMQALYGEGQFTAYDEMTKYVWQGNKVLLTGLKLEAEGGNVTNLHFLNISLYQQAQAAGVKPKPE